MNNINTAKVLLIINWIYFIIYNTHFGWNELPINETEKLCDDIFQITIVLVILLYIDPIFNKYENWIKTK